MSDQPVATHHLAPMRDGECWQAGVVLRYHAEVMHRNQNVGEHSWGVALLCSILWSDRPDLLRAAVWHDVPEKVLGDTPHPAKGIFVDRVREKNAETLLLGEYAQHVDLKGEDATRLAIADMLEFVLYCLREVTMGNRYCYPKSVKGRELVDARIATLTDPNERMRLKDWIGEIYKDITSPGERYS